MTIYYIDMENIGSRKWDYLIKELKPNDCIVIFYSDKADTISANTLHQLQIKKVTVKYIYSYPGKKGGNAMDFQITALLGYGIARLGKNTAYRIISNDSGYNPVATYWRHYNYDINVIHPDTDMMANKTPVTSATIQKNRKMLKNELMQIEIPEKEAGLIAIMMEHASKKRRNIRCVSMHSRLNEQFGKERGDELYKKLEKYFIRNLQN